MVGVEIVGDPRPLGHVGQPAENRLGASYLASLGSMLNGIELPDG